MLIFCSALVSCEMRYSGRFASKWTFITKICSGFEGRNFQKCHENLPKNMILSKFEGIKKDKTPGLFTPKDFIYPNFDVNATTLLIRNPFPPAS